ncbi:hypothetical protein [Tritonibacter mobilis]|uniref:hypothetical protein n=1 Tax=Tritonibacter mobilis TaxID=379347 RepID=UPI001CD9532B|nr:hypothetical protein [Tritonibacter mobilis]MCA2007952.1 hypothetical protein [Tritonibacter mobilis]
MKPTYINTPREALYPLTAKQALIVTGQRIVKDQGVYVFTMADGRDILIKAPFDAVTGDHILPEGSVLDAQTPFIAIHSATQPEAPVAMPPKPSQQTRTATAMDTSSSPPQAQPPEMEASPELAHKDLSAPEPEPSRPPHTDLTKPNPALATLIAVLIPLVIISAMVWVRDFVFHDVFQEEWAFVLKMLIGLAAGFAAYKLAVWLQQRLARKVDRSNLSFGFGVILPFLMLFPAGLYLDILEDLGMNHGITPGDGYHPPNYGDQLESLARYSNGNTPTPSPQELDTYQKWLDD